MKLIFFFHKWASMRKCQNYISMLEKEDNGVILSEDDIVKEVVKIFETLYLKEECRRFNFEGLNWALLNAHWSESLEAPFEEEEIYNAARYLGNLKSLGLDGMISEFYEKSWNILKPDLVWVFQDPFGNEIVNKKTNETYICLISKKKRTSKVKDFKPISLVTPLYKIISRDLAERPKEMLPIIIDDAQASFVEGHQILDAISRASERWKTVGKKEKKVFC